MGYRVRVRVRVRARVGVGVRVRVRVSERLHLRVLHDLARLLHLALRLVYHSERLREPRALHLHKDLAL